MKTNILYTGDCVEVMRNNIDPKSVDVILTSPPYNTARNGAEFFNDVQKRRYTTRYVSFNDNKSDKEYSDWTITCFNEFDKVLVDNGTVLYNLSYGVNTHASIWQLIADIQNNTAFEVADMIPWKKSSAVPNTASPNKLTRICEFVFVFCRHNEYETFHTNKRVVSLSKRTQQKNYENIFNFIEAKNNDGSCPIHKATFSSDLCQKLLRIYGPDNGIVFDPFIGTGTTAVAALQMNMRYIGCDIYEPYIKFSKERLGNYIGFDPE